MAGQAHDGLAAAFAQNGWFSGLNGDSMEQKGAQRFNDPAGGVLHTNAAAAGNDHQITAVFSRFYGSFELLFLILQDAIILRFRAKSGEQSLKHGAVHIPDLAGAGLLLRRHQFIPGGEDAHPELLHHRHLNAADGGQGADVPVGQQAALFQPENYERCLEVTAKLEEIGKKYDKSPAQVCINWMISNPALTAPIIGGTDDRHARQNLEAMSFRLSQEDYDTIDSVSKEFCSRLPEYVLFFNSQIRE